MLDLISNDSAPATLPIAQIRRDGGTQPRQGMDEDAVNDYANALRNGERLPAVDVMFDGAAYWLFDGFHRTEAHMRAGLADIAVTIHRGTLEDAQWRSFGANKGHGLRRSNADKERAVRAALRHVNGVGLSNVQIARHVGVDDKTVARYRGEMESTSEIPRLPTRTGADGKERKAPNPYAPRRVATFKADAADPNSADVHVMGFAHVQPKPPPSPAPAPANHAGPADSLLAPPVAPMMPADLARYGWELRQISGTDKWWCYNRSGSKATGTYEQPADAIAEAVALAGKGRGNEPPPPAPEEITLRVRLTGSDAERRALYAWLTGLKAEALTAMAWEWYATNHEGADHA